MPPARGSRCGRPQSQTTRRLRTCGVGSRSWAKGEVCSAGAAEFGPAERRRAASHDWRNYDGLRRDLPDGAADRQAARGAGGGRDADRRFGYGGEAERRAAHSGVARAAPAGADRARRPGVKEEAKRRAWRGFNTDRLSWTTWDAHGNSTAASLGSSR